MQYPIFLTFKLIAIANQIYVRDANGQSIAYVKQKLLKLKEQVLVFRDESQNDLLYRIDADRMIDFSARYNFQDAGGTYLGSIGRRGMKSIWRAYYEIFDQAGNLSYVIQEEKVFVKVMDGLISSIPIIGILVGLFLNPTYLISNAAGDPIARLIKEPAFFEGKFRLERISPVSPSDEANILLSLMMMTLLERQRG